MSQVTNLTILRTIFVLIAVCLAVLPAKAQSGGGRGTSEEPVSNPLDMSLCDACVARIRMNDPGMELHLNADTEDNLLVNGGFEEGPADSPDVSIRFISLSLGSTLIPGWRVTRGEIDYQQGYWQAADGTHSIDLYGSPSHSDGGGIGQTFPTTPQRLYRVTFWLSGNPEGPVGEDPVKWLWVQAAGQTGLFSFDCTKYTKSNMGWRQVSWVFTAVEAATTVEFFSLYMGSGSAYYGPALDRVSVREVPEGPPRPVTIYVDDDAAGDSGPGDPEVSDAKEDGSPAHPYDAIQKAIDAANSLDTIVVLDGTYTGIGNRGITFEGKNITVRSKNGPADCIIDGQGQGRAFYFCGRESPTAVLQGFTVRNCDVSQESSRSMGRGYGGAVYCDVGAKPTIRDCVFKDNLAAYGGGAVTFFGESAPILVNCGFVNNTVTVAEGGAVRGFGATLTADGCTFQGNSAKVQGGAICAYCNVTLKNCEFSGNSVAGQGGAVYTGSSSSPLSQQVKVQGCTLTANSAASGRSFALYGNNPQVLIENCILWNGASEIDARKGTSITVAYSDVRGGWPGGGNVNTDPCFADPSNGDYHLKSQAGRWDPKSQRWVQDGATSACIDRGNPDSDWAAEPWPHGKRVNMGVFGGTPQASMSLSDAGNVADLNLDSAVNFRDLAHLAARWRTEQVLLREDVDRNGVVGFSDLAVLADNWLGEIKEVSPVPVAYWKLDESQGTVARDVAGSHDGTLWGGPVWQPQGGKIGGALQFDGVDDYASVPFVVNPADAPFSVFAWVKGDVAKRVILSQAGGTNWLSVAANGALMTELNLPGRPGTLTSSAVITGNTWHRVGLVWDGFNRVLYVDDVEVAKDTQASLPGSTAGLYIGAGSKLSPGTFWSGLIDDVRIYDRDVKPGL